MKTKSAVLKSKKTSEIIERDLGEPGDNEVIIKNWYCNLCTTDYQHWMGLREHQGYPTIGGHENSAEVVKVGKNVRSVEVGDKVAIAYDFCGKCRDCLLGYTYACKNVEKPQVSEDGYYGFLGLSNYQKVKDHMLIKLSKDVDMKAACFVEPLATVLNGYRKMDLRAGSTVVIIGAGTMGLLNALVYRSMGQRVILSELQDKQINRAKELGFTVIDAENEDPVEKVMKLTDGQGADLVIPAVGSSRAYEQGFEMLKELGGQYLFFAAGYPKPKFTMDPNEVHYREIQFIGTMGANSQDFQLAGDLISNKIIDVLHCAEGEIFKLEEIQSAYERASELGTYRITVQCN